MVSYNRQIREKIDSMESVGEKASRVFRYLVFGGAAIAAVAIGTSYSNHSVYRRDMVALEENQCEWKPVVADLGSHYRRWAVQSIKESNDLGKKVGVDRVEGYIRERNDNRDIVKGQTYDVLDCD